jgi:hypothetical protein
MSASEDSTTYHSRFCAIRNRNVALLFFLFSALEVFLRVKELNHPPSAEQKTVIYYVAVIAVIAALVDLWIVLSCWRERLALGFAITSFAILLFSRLPVVTTALAAYLIRDAQLLLWVGALGVTGSSVFSAFRKTKR